MRTPAIIFDFGNVVAFFDYARACEAIGRPRGRGGPELLEAARASGLDDLVRRLEGGRLSDREFSEACCALLDLPGLSPDEFAAGWADIFWPNESIIPLIEALDAGGYRLVLGSNTNAIHAAHIRRQFAATLSRFDRLVFSFEVGHVKPSPGFYLACAEAAGSRPADCVFIDDLPENVDGARRAGLIGLHYHDTPGLERDLRHLGIDLPSVRS